MRDGESSRNVATFGDRCDVGKCKSKHVERERKALAVEIPCGNDLDRVVEDDRVVGDGVEVDCDQVCEEPDPLARGAVHLRDAAKRVRILDVALACPEALRTGCERPHDLGRPLLARQRPEGVHALAERRSLAAQSLQRQRGDCVRTVEEPAGAQREQRADRRHEMGPVDQGQCLLRRQLDRLDAGGRERSGGRARRAVGSRDLPLADERQKRVRRRREITAGSERAGSRDDGRESGVQDLGYPLDDRRPHARVPAQEPVQPHGDRCADDRRRKRRADACGMAAQDVALCRNRLVEAQPLPDEGTETRRDTVDRVAAVDRLLERRTVLPDARERLRIQEHRCAGCNTVDT